MYIFVIVNSFPNFTNRRLQSDSRKLGFLKLYIASERFLQIFNRRGSVSRDSGVPSCSQSSQFPEDREWRCKYPLWCPHNKILFWNKKNEFLKQSISIQILSEKEIPNRKSFSLWQRNRKNLLYVSESLRAFDSPLADFTAEADQKRVTKGDCHLLNISFYRKPIFQCKWKTQRIFTIVLKTIQHNKLPFWWNKSCRHHSQCALTTAETVMTK